LKHLSRAIFLLKKVNVKIKDQRYEENK
jgi:hypothetical protein